MDMKGLESLGEKLSDINDFQKAFPEVDMMKCIDCKGYVSSAAGSIKSFVMPIGTAVFYPSEAEIINCQSGGTSASMLYEGRYNDSEKEMYRMIYKFEVPLLEIFKRNGKEFAIILNPENSSFYAILTSRIDKIILKDRK